MTQEKLRHLLLFLFILPMSIFVAVADIYNIFDPALVMYILCLGMLTICLLVWGLWWFFSRYKATTIFKVNYLILASFWYFIANTIYGRYINVYLHAQHEALLDTTWWAYRITPLLIIFVWLVCWSVGRVFGKDEEVEGMIDKKLKILLVDDEEGVCQLMHQSVDSLGVFETVCCNNSTCALEAFRPGEFICVVLDLNLKESPEDGIKLALKIRELDKDVFIGIVSGYFKEALDERLMLTVDDFIQKPFELATFKLKVFLWAIKYRKRLEIKKYVDESDFQLRDEIIRTIDEKLKKHFLK